jgi:hypothetical protein
MPYVSSLDRSSFVTSFDVKLTRFLAAFEPAALLERLWV